LPGARATVKVAAEAGIMSSILRINDVIATLASIDRYEHPFWNAAIANSQDFAERSNIRVA
jgi:hypothetical protein